MSLPGSLAEPADVLANPVSLELRSALEILLAEARRRGLPVMCVARPEMFTHGMAEAWFRARVSPLAQHVCLSDGSSVKHLPGLPTHVFFYGLMFRDAVAALRRLSRRAPELMINLGSQVNSCLTLGRAPCRVRPEPVLLSRTTALRVPPPLLLPFFLNRDSAEDSANRVQQAGPVAAESLLGFSRMLYVPLTETALDDGAFGHAVTELILQTFFDPTTLLVLKCPAACQVEPSLTHGIATLLAAVRKSSVMLPRSSPPNILFAASDLEEDHVIFDRFPFCLVVHDSFDFWRHTKGFYARAQEVTVLARQGSATEEFNVAAIYGPNAVRRWVVDPADHG